MNPADSFSKVTKNFFQSANRTMIARLEGLIQFINDGRIHDSIVRSLDADSTDRMTVDVYEEGFGSAPTRLEVDCYVMDNWEEFKIGYPAKVILKDGMAYAVSGLHLLYLKPTSYATNKAVGKPCDRDGVAHATIVDNINVNFGFPFDSIETTNSLEMDVWAWIRYPRPYDCGDFDSAGLIIFGAAGLPIGTGRYKVLQLIDDLDPGTPAYDYERFS